MLLLPLLSWVAPDSTTPPGCSFDLVEYQNSQKPVSPPHSQWVRPGIDISYHSADDFRMKPKLGTTGVQAGRGAGGGGSPPTSAVTVTATRAETAGQSTGRVLLNCLSWPEVSDAAEHPALHRMSPPEQRTSKEGNCPQQRLRNLDLAPAPTTSSVLRLPSAPHSLAPSWGLGRGLISEPSLTPSQAHLPGSAIAWGAT